MKTYTHTTIKHEQHIVNMLKATLMTTTKHIVQTKQTNSNKNKAMHTYKETKRKVACITTQTHTQTTSQNQTHIEHNKNNVQNTTN